MDMGIFATDEKVTFYEMLDTHATKDYCFELGEVLKAQGAIPRELRDIEAMGRARVLPDPGDLLPWFQLRCRIRSVNDKTFAVRAERPEPTYIDEPTLLRREGWTPEQLRRAQTRIGFPKAAKRREKYVEGAGVETIALLWDEEAVDAWRRTIPRDLIGA
jgi:hypothetical protein